MDEDVVRWIDYEIKADSRYPKGIGRRQSVLKWLICIVNGGTKQIR